MAFIVEDGSGRSDATAYLTVAEADTYASDHTTPAGWGAASSATKEAAIRAATDFLDRQYAGCWKGDRYTLAQRLSWPRARVMLDGYELSAAPLPRELREACAELAFKSFLGEALMPDITDPSAIVQESVSVGPISKSVTYSGSKALAARRRTIETLVMPLLRDADVVGRA